MTFVKSLKDVGILFNVRGMFWGSGPRVVKYKTSIT